MRFYLELMLAGASLVALSTASHAQEAPARENSLDADVSGAIIVTARRKDESIQDVPLTVNAVSADTLEKLNIRELKDISAVVPGLVLNPGLATTGPSASLRGVGVDVIASGNNGTVEFYLNDAPISANAVLQSMFDVGQIEVLRGPQGTLRGRASPSGSITVTTRRPDMYDFGGYALGTVNSRDGINVQGAINIPIATEVLALRVAGLVDHNQFNGIRSANNPRFDPYGRTGAYRASLRFAPSSNIEINASYSHLKKEYAVFDQVESANLALGLPVVGQQITARDRLAVEDRPRVNSQEFDFYNLQAQWSILGQALNYVGSYTKQYLDTEEPADKGNFFGDEFGGNTTSASYNLQNLPALSVTRVKQQSHELRLSSEERLFGIMSYVIGGLINRVEPTTQQQSVIPIFGGNPPTPENFITVLGPLPRPTRVGRQLERAVFGNLTFYIGTQTELAGGIRYINYRENNSTNGGTDKVYNPVIWNASLKHRFNDNFMAYASAGSSWRLGTNSNGAILQGTTGFSLAEATDPIVLGSLTANPETSKSIEVGFKSSWFNRKLILNVAAFHQTFDGYIFSTPALYLVNLNPSPSVVGPSANGQAGLALNVPAKVNGIEAEISYKPSPWFDLGATLAYAKSKINGGEQPCNPVPGIPSVSDIQATNPGGQVGLCPLTQRATRLAPISATIRAEFSQPVMDNVEGFVRTLVNVSGSSQNDPQNPLDDIKSYSLANLYLGVRNPDGGWEIAAYVKNLFDTQRVLSRESTPYSVGFLAGSTPALSPTTNYRGITVNDPREFGITARYSFGSR